MLNGHVYHNNSATPLTEVGEGKNALLCKTDKEECCGMAPNLFGKLYSPSGVQVPLLGNSRASISTGVTRSYV